MPSSHPDAPRRWVDQTGDTGEARLGALFRAVPEPESLSAAVLSQVHAGLTNARSRGSRRTREVLLAAAMLVAGSSLALAGWGVSAGRDHPAASSPSKQAAASHATLSPSLSAHTEFPSPAESTAAPASPGNVLAPHARPAAADASESAQPTESSSALAVESAALERVLVKLRREHDAQGALSLLDESESLFLHGALALEARVARVDALLMLGRDSEALALLDHLPFAQIGRGGELRLVRAELRAKTDCARALADFGVLSTLPLPSALAERAVYGRAACELQGHDESGAARDLNLYVSRFPHGRFAEHVRQELARLATTR